MGTKEVLVVTVDDQSRDNIELVPHKAAAGYYLNGYADPSTSKSCLGSNCQC